MPGGRGGARAGGCPRGPVPHGGGDGGAVEGAGPAHVGGALRAARRAPRIPERLRKGSRLRRALRETDRPGRRVAVGRWMAGETSGRPRAGLRTIDASRRVLPSPDGNGAERQTINVELHNTAALSPLAAPAPVTYSSLASLP